jgi:hypothetical protein
MNPNVMLASEAVDRFGDQLIGKTIETIPYGAWPGGFAKVIEIAPDPNAPEIVMTVKAEEFNTLVTLRIERGDLYSDEIGVFENEQINIGPTGLLPIAA